MTRLCQSPEQGTVLASRTASPSHDKGQGCTEIEDEDKAEDLSALPSEDEGEQLFRASDLAPEADR